jgi:hypothetical protein
MPPRGTPPNTPNERISDAEMACRGSTYAGFFQHFHADHPVLSWSKSEQEQLNCLGQFSVSGNNQRTRYPDQLGR